LFVFFADEIHRWKLNDKDEYMLGFGKANFEERLSGSCFSHEAVEKIKRIINEANVLKEIQIIMPRIEEKEVRFEKSGYGHQVITIDKPTGAEIIESIVLGDPQDSI
jgi:hypothetical protein